MINITEVTERSVYNDRTPHHQNIILWLERGFFFWFFFLFVWLRSDRCEPLTYLCRARVWVTQINREHMMNLMATSIQAGRAMLL